MGVTIDKAEVSFLRGEDEIALAEECKQQQGRRKLFLEKLYELGKGCAIITAKLAGSPPG